MRPAEPFDVPPTATTRRRVLKTGARLAYAAPVVAATMKLGRLTALADGTCDCSGTPGGTFDETPYGGGGPACCTCVQCQSGGRGGIHGDVIYPGAYYNPATNLCADADFPNGFSASYCAPVCTPCGAVSH